MNYWQDLLGIPIFSADGVPGVVFGVPSAPDIPFKGTIISTYFDSGYCDQDMDCRMNRLIANVATVRMGVVLTGFPILQSLAVPGTALRSCVRHGLLHFEFGGMAIPICVTHRIMKAFLASCEGDSLRVRLSPEDGWHSAAFSGIILALH